MLVTDGKTFSRERTLHEEIFGPATLLVKCENADELLELAGSLDGQLTATIHAEQSDEAISGPVASCPAGKGGPDRLEQLSDRCGGSSFHAPWRTISRHD